jgi:HSP20 family molecular chaperone IbpA
MHTIIPTTSPSDTATETNPAYRQPHFECTDLSQALKITVLVPGVEDLGVDIVTRGPDLIVTAQKARVVRVNWQALHLEGAQKDYQLKLRLGLDFDFERLHAHLCEGVLTILVPKQESALGKAPVRQRRVA